MVTKQKKKKKNAADILSIALEFIIIIGMKLAELMTHQHMHRPTHKSTVGQI
jgi:hypothetical protein